MQPRQPAGRLPTTGHSQTVQMEGLRGNGAPLSQQVRGQFEPRFGRDFSGVQIHTSPVAAESARSIGARAYTAGSDIVFAPGEYAPESRGGQRLLAHELTHVVQQEATGAQNIVRRDPTPASSDTTATANLTAGQPQRITSMDGFQTQVFSRATSRLDANCQQLDVWRTYINSSFDDIELKAQLAGTESQALIGSARTLKREQYLEPYFAARSPATRALNEGILNGRINSGCQQCHESNIVWQWNVRHPEFQRGPTTAEELRGLANYANFMGPHAGSLPAPVPNVAAPQIAPETPANNPGAVQAGSPTSINAPPPALTYPVIHSDLCGDVPPESVTPAPFDPTLWGPNTTLAVNSIQRINPVLEPLGPAGYKVLPQGIFSDLYNRTPAQLRSLVMDNINERQMKYMHLKALIMANQVDYKELCPIVAELLPQADPGVQAYVRYDIAQQRFWDTVLDIILAIVGAALILLSIVFPPAMLLTAGLIVGAMQIGVGMRDYEKGYYYDLGTGANVFSKQQEAAAPGLMVGGAMNILMGTVSVATSGLGLARLSGGSNLPARGPTGRFQPLPDGSYMAIHPQNPEIVVILEGDQLTAGMWVEGEFKPIAQARSPWPAGSPPPNTPTWAEWAAANGMPTYGGGFGGGQVAKNALVLAPRGSPPGMGALTPYPGGPFILGAPPNQSLLMGPTIGQLRLPPGTIPILDPGGRGVYMLDESLTGRLPVGDAARLRFLQSGMPASEAELAELVALRKKAAGMDLPLEPGTPEHMLDGWNKYKSPARNGKLNFNRWAAGQPSRMRNSLVGNEVEAEYRDALTEAGAPARNAVLQTKSGQARQIDALIEGAKDGKRDMIQIKAGEESLSKTDRQSGGASYGSSSLSNEDALVTDAEFIKDGDRVTWVFEKRPSGPLVARARELGVGVIIRVDNAAAQAKMVSLMQRAGMSEAEIKGVTFVIGTREDVVNFVVKKFTPK